jgi:hypothetical protein
MKFCLNFQFEGVLAKLDSDIAREGADKKKTYDDVWKQLGDLGVTHNIYTASTPNTLANSRASLDAAVNARKKRYEAELARQVLLIWPY